LAEQLKQKQPRGICAAGAVREAPGVNDSFRAHQVRYLLTQR